MIGTVFPQFDFAREIGKDRIDCEMLLPPGADSHSYTGDDPSDIYRIMNCDLFIYVGGETDSAWVDKIKNMIDEDGEKSPRFLSLCEVCDVLTESSSGIIEGEEEENGEDEEEYDEHVWTSPKNAIKVSRAIADALCEIDPGNAAFYKDNCDEYIAKLTELDSSFTELAGAAKLRTLVFADRFPFRYLADEMGLKCYAAFNGCASQSEPSPTTVVKLCKIVEEQNLPYVFYIETSQSDVPELISSATGCETLLLHSCHTVTQGELHLGASYLSLMTQNLENLKKALTDEQ